MGAILGGAGLIAAWRLNTSFFGIVVAYLALNVLYSTFLKRVVLLDVFIVAAGFLFRVIAGGLVIRVAISPWLIVCTTLLALFIALSKRRHELVLLGAAPLTTGRSWRTTRRIFWTSSSASSPLRRWFPMRSTPCRRTSRANSPVNGWR